jgi:cysteinyl-tRNA synthetase
MKESYQPEIYEKDRLNKKVNVDDEAAYEMARRLAREEGIFVGMSSGAAMAIALEEVKSMSEGVVVVILPDGGERYLSTPLFTILEQTNLRFFNTISRTKESFQPLRSGNVSMYSCGPTLHDRLHIGECRRLVLADLLCRYLEYKGYVVTHVVNIVLADLLCRYLEYKGYVVTHVVNITDFDDKTIQGSEKAGMELKPFADQYAQAFFEDAAILGIKSAKQYPRASEHVDDMVALTGRLLEKGFAYEKLQSVYFDISRFADYGNLSGIDLGLRTTATSPASTLTRLRSVPPWTSMSMRRPTPETLPSLNGPNCLNSSGGFIQEPSGET